MRVKNGDIYEDRWLDAAGSTTLEHKCHVICHSTVYPNKIVNIKSPLLCIVRHDITRWIHANIDNITYKRAYQRDKTGSPIHEKWNK